MSVIDWNMEARNILKAVRAVGYLEGMSATLWRLAGPEIADEAIVDYDKDRGEYCNDCRLCSHGKMDCLDAMMADIVSRVNRLAGDSE